ncbi:MAG: tRNA (cytidine(34)-2'-O)-methyltransferase [Candidatus Berkiellales bacterium]
MFSIILFQPEIPPNTGNIIRLCANTGCGLHLIEPLGFTLEDKQLLRAGLDYHEFAKIAVYPDLTSCLNALSFPRLFALSAKGSTPYTQPRFQPNDAFLFGPETRGLSKEILATFSSDHILRLPQYTEKRSLNLANTAAVMVYEAWRQNDFAKVFPTSQ